MDDDRFDTVSRLLGSRGTRRAGLTTLLGGALGLSGLIHADEGWAKTGRCKRSCGSCKTCKRVACTRTFGGKRCKRDKCVPVRNGTRCSGGTCLGGRCAPFPTPPPPPPPCLALQENCNDVCCDGLVCAESRCTFSDRLCVLPEGELCNDDNCSCAQGQKCSPVTDRCRACISDPAETCREPDDCCLPGALCESRTPEVPPTCCIGERNESSFCLDNDVCCEGLVCAQETGRCVRVS